MVLLQRFRLLAMVFAIATLVSIGQTRAELLEIRVSQTSGGADFSDDVEEFLSNADSFDQPIGRVDVASSDLELGTDYRTTVGQGPYNQLVGLRFLNVTIPTGSVINSASIQFMVDEDDKSAITASYDIFGELSVNPDTYADSETASFTVSTRATTTNSVQWQNVPSWTGNVGSAGPDQETPDLSLILQELIDQPGWSSGNPVAFQISAMAGFEGSSRVAESSKNDLVKRPMLKVDFTIPEPSTVLLTSFGLLMTLVRRPRSFC